MNRAPVTLQEIAAVAGCSKRTVAAVLNAGGNSSVRVGAAMQQRILETAREKGYRPNRLAQAVATGKNRVLGVVTDSNQVEHKAYMLAGAIEAANDCDYLIKVLPTRYGEVSDEPIEKCIEWQMAGLLVVNLSVEVNDYLRRQTAKLGLPLALLDNVAHHDDCISVVSDDEQGVDLALQHLIELGHKNIGFLGGSVDTPASLEREIFFRNLLDKYGLAARDEWISQSDWGLASRIEPVARRLLSGNRPTAIVCAGDAIAMALIRVARSLEIQVPRDLSVIGFANFYLSRFCDPPLTTVEQPFREMGRVATQRLIELCENSAQSPAFYERLPTKLVRRHSTAPLN